MRLWKFKTLLVVLLVIFSGCSSLTPKPKDEVVVDPTLQVVELTKNGVFTDMNAVAFEWKNITDPRVKGIYVYKKALNQKAEKGDEADEYYDTIKGRFTTHYLDRKITPNTQYNYYFKTFSDKAESKMSKVIVVSSLPVLKSVAWIHSVEGLPKSAKIIWRPHSNQKVKAYIIERKTLEDEKWQKLATVNGRLNAEYIDRDLKDNYVYKYRIRVVTYDGITSAPSATVKVITKALPKPVKGALATKTLPKAIEISWEKSNMKDFSHYRVYRCDKLDGSYDLIAKVKDPKFIDDIDENGKSYFYRISAVDKDGLESKHSKVSVYGMTLPRPNAPAVVEAKLIDDKIKLSWSKVDPRTQKYTIVRKAKKGWFDSVISEIKDVPSTQYTDVNIAPNTVYFYQIYAVDKNGIKSEPSIEVKVHSKEVAQEEVSQTNNKEVEVVPAPVVEKVQVDTQEKIIPTNDFN